MENTNIKLMVLFLAITIIAVCYVVIYKKYLPKKQQQINNAYRKLYESIKHKEYIYSLCNEIRNFLTAEEQKIIEKHFIEQKPSLKINQEFFNNETYLGANYWWIYNYYRGGLHLKEATKQRKLFILKMIKITDKK